MFMVFHTLQCINYNVFIKQCRISRQEYFFDNLIYWLILVLYLNIKLILFMTSNNRLNLLLKMTKENIDGFPNPVNEKQFEYIRYLNGIFHKKLNTNNRLKIDSKFYKVMDSHEMRDKIINLRKLLNVPNGGLNAEGVDNLELVTISSFLKKDIKKRAFKKDMKYIKNVLKRYCIMTMQWEANLVAYIYFNRIPNFPSNNICELRSTGAICNSTKGLFRKPIKSKNDTEDHLDNYPIAILINPYASNNAIKEFIETVKDDIDKMRGLYRVEDVEKTRKKNKRNRDSLIIKLYKEGKTKKQIFNQINLDYPNDNIDEGGIRKIVSIHNTKKPVKLNDTT